MPVGPRNLAVAPFLSAEGVLEQPLKIPSALLEAGVEWADGLSPFDRVHYHQTLSSVRRYTHFKPLPGLISNDVLDLSLNTEYNHGADEFPDKVDVVMQGTTMGTDKRRKTRNNEDFVYVEDATRRALHEAWLQEKVDKVSFGAGSPFGSGLGFSNAIERDDKKKPKPPVRYNTFHVVHIGGIKARKHPMNVKLMNSGHHSPQTNAGYSRQDSDGNSYQY